MALATAYASPDTLAHLPTPGRPRVDPAEVVVPDGYDVDVLVVGLSFPTGMGFAEDGTLFILEGGSVWPTRPYLPARVLRLAPDGALDALTEEEIGGPRGVVVRDGSVYVSSKGGYHSRITRYDQESGGDGTVIVDGLPNGGWHEPGGPLFGPDGLLYFAQGSVSQNGIIQPHAYIVDLARHPRTHDVPGQDVTLCGNNIDSFDPRPPYPYMVSTGAFKPFGVDTHAGEVIKGELKCSSGLWRAQPDGTEMELLAWGLRNPYGMAFGEDGELYVSDNDFEETGERAVKGDPDRLWRIGAARRPHGSVATPEWYGFPDICGDGLPVWDEAHLPDKGRPAMQLIADPPDWAGPAAFLERPHSCMTKLDCSRSDAFGHRGRLFQCEWGTLAPLNSPHDEDRRNGFKVICIDPEAGTAQDFMRNREPGPASVQDGAGLERPVDCKFHPDGRSLYVLDFGLSPADAGKHMSFGHTGVLWRITRKAAR